jgi:hypothetical protein
MPGAAGWRHDLLSRPFDLLEVKIHNSKAEV